MFNLKYHKTLAFSTKWALAAVGLFIAIQSTAQERVMSMGLDKMNVLYIGVDNPLTIAIEGLNSDEFSLSSETLTIQQVDNGKYNVLATRPGDAQITVTTDDGETQIFNFRVKRIPDPVAGLGNNLHGGTMHVGTFRAQAGVAVFIPGFAFDARCSVVSYEVTRVPKREDKVTKINEGDTYNDDVMELIQLAKPGDIYYFDNIKIRCPGDAAARKIHGLVFKIK